MSQKFYFDKNSEFHKLLTDQLDVTNIQKVEINYSDQNFCLFCNEGIIFLGRIIFKDETRKYYKYRVTCKCYNCTELIISSSCVKTNERPSNKDNGYEICANHCIY